MFIIDDSLPHAYYIYVGSAELVDHAATQSSPVTRLLCVRALVDLLGGIGMLNSVPCRNTLPPCVLGRLQTEARGNCCFKNSRYSHVARDIGKLDHLIKP